MNIAVIVLDTLRRDTFQDFFDWVPGCWYENAYSPSHWTIPVHASLLTGRYPSEHGTRAKARFFEYRGETLAERLQKAGYRTRGFSANPNISKYFNFSRGFDEFYEARPTTAYSFARLFDWSGYIDESSKEGFLRDADAVWRCIQSDVNRRVSIIDGINQKLNRSARGKVSDKGATSCIQIVDNLNFGKDEFLFINLMEMHAPYVAPEAYHSEPWTSGLTLKDSFVEEDPDVESRAEAYEACAKYLSHSYEDLFSLLRRSFDMIITLSDHGEMFGEHGIFGHEFGLYPQLTHVPLSVYEKDKQLPKSCDEPRSLLDVYDTVLDRAGLSDGQSHGIPLTNSSERCYLTEYHGLYERLIDYFGNNDVNIDLDGLDRNRRGLVAPLDYFRFETMNGVSETGEYCLDDPPLEKQQEIVGGFETGNLRADNEVSSAVERRLNKMGYL